jgi:putative ABC transport system permease protein
MLIIFLRSAYRSLLKNKVFSILTISGLAIGMAACFFIFQYVYYERSYESYNSNADNIYRVPLTLRESSGTSYTKATNYPAVGPALKAEFPEVASFARVIPSDVRIGTSTISRKNSNGITLSANEPRLYSADSRILKMFSIPLVYGDSSAISHQMRGLLLSETTAKKYFGTENPVDQGLFLNGTFPVTVAGVFKDIPENSHFKPDIIICFPDSAFHADDWSRPEFYTYITLQPGVDAKTFEAKLQAFMARHLGSKQEQGALVRQLSLQPIKDIHLTSHYRQELESNADGGDIWFLSILSLFVLLIAYINYINLSTAKSIERAGEVGIRKVIGASRIQLTCQFLFESLIVNLLALLLAIVLAICLTPLYQNLTGKSAIGWFWTSGLITDIKFWIALFSIVIGSALLIGAYPALLMSKYKPILVLKGKFYGSGNGIVIRKVLSTFQFMLSIVLIAGSLVFVSQFSFMRNQTLGYDNAHTIVVRTPGLYDDKEFPKIQTLQRELLQNSPIKNVGLSTDIPGVAIVRKSNASIFGQPQFHYPAVSVTQVDNHFFNTYQVPLVAGRGFEPTDSLDVFPIDGVSYPDKISIVVNESFVQNIGIKTNNDALGKLINFNLDEHPLRGEVVGVVKNYHQTSLKDPYQPAVYIFPSRALWRYFTINLATTSNIEQTIALVQQAYKELFPINPFEFFFQNDYFNEQYKSDERVANIFYVFTGLTVFICCLGLLGLLSFIMRIRFKEIGIRRVLGASIYSIVLLFYKDFFRLLVLAILLAFPVIYFLRNEWLNNFAFQSPLKPFAFIGPPLILIIITFIVVAVQSIRTLSANPVAALRDE